VPFYPQGDKRMHTLPDFEYKGWELNDALNAIYAYDKGFTDSGVSDPIMMQAVSDYFGKLDRNQTELVVSNYLFKYCLSPEAIMAGYGVADAQEFIKWWEENFYL